MLASEKPPSTSAPRLRIASRRAGDSGRSIAGMFRLLYRVRAGPLLSHGLHVLGPDPVDHAHLARRAERVVLAEVLVRELVDVGIGAVLGDRVDPAAHLQVAVAVLGILDSERYARIAPH